MKTEMNAIQTIKIQTQFGGEHEVANYSNGKLAFWRRGDNGAVFSDYPARTVKNLKEAKAQIQAVYFNEKVI